MTDLICIDFDKTLTKPSVDEWQRADEQTPDHEMIAEIYEQYISGNRIIIWTARQWSEAPQIAGWLTSHEVPYHGIKCGKGGADQYVDDKAMTPDEFIE